MSLTPSAANPYMLAPNLRNEFLTSSMKARIRDHYMMDTEQVDLISSIGSYVWPLQEFLNAVAANFTSYELNFTTKILNEQFPLWHQARWEVRSEELVLWMERRVPSFSCISIHVMKNQVQMFSQVPHEETSSGLSRLSRRT